MALALASPTSALTKMGELSEYHIDYADVKQGATITSPSKIHPESKLETIITPKYDGTFIFADGVRAARGVHHRPRPGAEAGHVHLRDDAFDGL